MTRFTSTSAQQREDLKGGKPPKKAAPKKKLSPIEEANANRAKAVKGAIDRRAQNQAVAASLGKK